MIHVPHIHSEVEATMAEQESMPSSSSSTAVDALPRLERLDSFKNRERAMVDAIMKEHERSLQNKMLMLSRKRCNKNSNQQNPNNVQNMMTATSSVPSQEQQQEHHHNNKKTKKASTTKTVGFHSRVRVRKIPLLDDMPDDVYDATYFTKEELFASRLDLRTQLLRHLQRLEEEDDDGDSSSCSDSDHHVDTHNDDDDPDYDNNDRGGVFYIRGLESELPTVKNDRRLVRLMARNTVLKLQCLQRSSASIAQAYHQSSLPAVDLAVQMAAQDEQQARGIYKEED